MMVEKQQREKGEMDGPKSRITALCSMVPRQRVSVGVEVRR